MRRRPLLLTALSSIVFAATWACSSFSGEDGDDPTTSPNPTTDANASNADANADSTSSSSLDAGPQPPRCDPDDPFGTPEIIPSLNFPNRHTLSGRVAGDFFYFISDRHNASLNFDFADIYRAKFFGDGFTDIQHLTVLSTMTEDVAPTESADGLTIYLATGKISARRIVRSTRGSRLESYPAPTDLAINNTTRILNASITEGDPYLVGNRMYFAAEATDVGTDNSLIYSVEVGANGPTGPATRVAGPFNGKLRYPVVNAQQTELYFIEYIGSVPTPFVARRAPNSAPSTPFTDPAAQPQLKVVGSDNLNTTGLSADGCDLYLASRPPGDAPFDMYRARRKPPPQ